MQDRFIIRSYGRTELAQLYCPSVSSQHAYRKLRGWMSMQPSLHPLLALKQRSFTPAQVAQIVEAIGEP